MNKIFKVIYSKAKHCYVVACEFAKSYSKGGGSRTLRRAAVALLAAAVYAASGSALANSGGTFDSDGNYVGDSPNYNVTIDSGCDGYVFGHIENSNNVSEANVTFTGGNGKFVFGGWAKSGDATKNSVNISETDSLNPTIITRSRD